MFINECGIKFKDEGSERHGLPLRHDSTLAAIFRGLQANISASSTPFISRCRFKKRFVRMWAKINTRIFMI